MARPKLEVLDDLTSTLLKPREVIAASLQAGAMLPGGGGTATTLSASKQPGIQMLHLPGVGLFITHKGEHSYTPDANLKEVWYKKQ